MQDQLLKLLQSVADGKTKPEIALENLKHLDFEAVGDFAKIDHHRTLRTGFPEVVFGIGKTPAQIIEIMRSLKQSSPIVMATKISADVHEKLVGLRGLKYFPVAQICTLGEPTLNLTGTVTILTAGTADIPIAEEAAITAELCGLTVKRLWDVGVAGIHRLLQNQRSIDDAEVLIVVAGMEGALASVVGGLADCPIIAVPTSIGYGASFNGIAPLLGMLNSCAPGIGVVNIDNGFGAAVLAAQILRQRR